MSAAHLTELRRWLASEGGLSAATIVSVLVPELADFAAGFGGGFGLGYAPADPGDLRRCLMALDRIPDGRRRIGEVAAAYPDGEWPALVAAWAELERMLHDEAAQTRGYVPRLYTRMRGLRARRLAAEQIPAENRGAAPIEISREFSESTPETAEKARAAAIDSRVLESLLREAEMALEVGTTALDRGRTRARIGALLDEPSPSSSKAGT